LERLPLSAVVEVDFPGSDLLAGESRSMRVDVFLSRRLHGYSRARVQRYIRDRRVFLRRGAGLETVKPSTRIGASDVVVVRYPKRPDPLPLAETLTVLFEDDAILAVDKPGCMLSHPTDKTLRNTVTWVLARQFPGCSLHLAHRLDRETSGVLMFSKDRDTARRLQAQFARRRVRKEYAAAVRGRVGFRTETVDRSLAREGGEIKVRQAVVGEEGRPAKTDFTLIAAGEEVSLVRAVPHSGRLHQIRVHLAWLGHPVLGDKLYTGSGSYYMKAVRKEIQEEDLRALGAPRQLLHARRLSFEHPSTGAPVTVESPLPADFAPVLERIPGLKRGGVSPPGDVDFVTSVL